MRARTIAAGALAAALAAGTPAAPAAAPQEGKVAEVLRAAHAALGGSTPGAISVEGELLRNVGSMQLTSDVEILLDLPHRYLRTDHPRGAMGGGVAMGFNGATLIRPAGGTVLPGGGLMIRMGPAAPGGPPPAAPLSPEEQASADSAMLRSLQVELSRLMLGWFATAHPALEISYTYAGEAESPDGRAHAIDADGTDGFRARLFLDETTHLPLMVTFEAAQGRVIAVEGGRRGAPPNREGAAGPLSEEERRKLREQAERRMADIQKQPPVLVEHTLYLDDWRDVGGRRFPHGIRRADAGVTTEEWTITRVRVNPRLDPKKFQG